MPDVRLPNGTIIKGVPEGTTKEQIKAKAIAAGLATEQDFGGSSTSVGQGSGYGQSIAEQATIAQPQRVPDGNLIDAVVEPLKSVGGALAGTSLGGWKAVGEWLSTGDIDSAVDALRKTQQEFASQPQTKAGQEGLRQVTRALETIERGVNFAAGGTAGLTNVALNPISNIQQGFDPAMQEASAVIEQGLGKAAGQEALNVTGSPLAATATELAPDIAEMAFGLSAGRAIDGVKPVARASIPQDKLVQAGERFDVPLLTTDVFPPESFLGKWISGKSDQLGALGSGSARVSQQQARVKVLEDLSTEFNVALDSPFFEQIVSSLSKSNARKLELGNIQRRKAIDKLNQYGEIDFPEVRNAVNQVIANERRLGAKANQSVINGAESYLKALNGVGFDDAAAVRTRLIQQQKDLEGSTVESKTPEIQALQSIKSAIDNDLKSFAVSNDRAAAANWLKANRNLAEQLSAVKETELARIIKKGEATPEVVRTIISGGKRSELQRLARNLGEDGRKAARAAIVKDLLDKSGAFNPDKPINVNKFATEMGKTNTRQAIDILFSDNQKMQLDAMERLLNATRQAQEVAVSTKTGQELVPLGAVSLAGYGAQVSPFTTLALAGTTAGALKAYDSKPMRELLMKIARTKKGSAEEKRILEVAIPAVLAAQMAAREQQQIDIVAER